jgi:type IV pilus assembly protein PilN
MSKPELVEIKSTGLGQGRDAKKVFDFSINVAIKRPRELEAAGASGATATASPASQAGAAAAKKP